ncbi:MAG: VOC family protein [Pseudomonadota bacterium]
MFDHVEFQVSDIAAARRFYTTLLLPVGVTEIFFDPDAGALGMGAEDIVRFLLTQGAPTTPRMHLCFTAPDRAAVDQGHAAALATGGRDNGAPGFRPDYGSGYYAGFVLDPDGHNVELLRRVPANGG